MSKPAAQAARAADQRAPFVAFVADAETEAAAQEAARRLLIPYPNVVRGTIATAIRKLQDMRSPRLLVVDISDSEFPLAEVNALADVCEPGVTVIVVGTRNDVGLFRDLVAAGVSDYLVKPVPAELLHRAMAASIGESGETRPGAMARKTGRLIAFIGARGGVGTSTLATGCAWLVAEEIKRRVALLDLDLQGGTAALYLDVEPRNGLREALEEPGRIDGLFVERVASRVSERLSVFADEEPLGAQAPFDPHAVDALLAELRAQFHYVLVDLPRGLTAAGQRVLEQASSVVLVTDLTLPALRDSARLIELIAASPTAPASIIVANRVGEFRAGTVTAEEFRQQTRHAIDLSVPFDAKSVAGAVMDGRPAASASGPVAKAMQDLAARLTGHADWASAKPDGGTLLRRLLGEGGVFPWMRRRS